MRRIAKFHKVSEEQFAEGFLDCFADRSEAEAKEVYNTLSCPEEQQQEVQDTTFSVLWILN